MAKFLMLKVLDVQFNRILPWKKTLCPYFFYLKKTFALLSNFEMLDLGGGGEDGGQVEGYSQRFTRDVYLG